MTVLASAWAMAMTGLVSQSDGQTEAYLEDMDMTGLVSAWAMARRRLKEYRHKVDAATRCSRVCPHTCPDLTWLD